MNGYEKAEIRARIIAEGKDPDAPPGWFENWLFSWGMNFIGVIVYSLIGLAIWTSLSK